MTGGPSPQEELKAAREKLRRKADVIGRLEGEAREQGAALEQAAHEGRALSHAHARLQSDLSDLQVVLQHYICWLECVCVLGAT